MQGLLAQLYAFASVVVIDLVLAGDNAVVVGMAAAGVSHEQRRRVIAIGILLALICRIAFALVAVRLLAVIGLLLAGGLLLLWVAWKMWRELHPGTSLSQHCADRTLARPIPKRPSTAIWQIAIADVSMSLDNVLAVAGAARDHTAMLIFGLVLSIGLMGASASILARFLERYKWLSYLGLGVITLVALSMVWEGGNTIWDAVAKS